MAETVIRRRVNLEARGGRRINPRMICGG